MLHQSLELAKSIKTYWFFNILGYSACYKLSSNLIKIWSHFCFKMDQNLIKNRSKNGIEFKAGFGIDIFSIFDRFLTNFGPILAPKWPAICCRDGLGNEFHPKLDFQSMLNWFYRLPKPLRDRFRSDFGSKNGPKIDQKFIKNRCLYSTSCLHQFFIEKFMLYQSLELAKSIKTYWFFNIFG